MEKSRCLKSALRKSFFLLGLVIISFIASGSTRLNANDLAASLENFQRFTFQHGVGNLSLLHRPGEGLPLVLIPGTFGNASSWAETVSYLPADMPLILAEHRGAGESWPPDVNTSIQVLAQEILWLLSKVDVEHFYVGGHSLGGMISLEMGRVAPERVKAIISVECWTFHLAEKRAFAGLKTITLTPELLQKRKERRARLEEKWGKERMNAFAKVWRKWDGREFLASTNLPILEIYGDRGREKPSLDALYIPERPNISVIWVADASHPIPAEKPIELAHIIQKYLKSQNEL